MLITERQFYNTAELREMVKGFELLFGCTPETRIKVRGPHGGPSGTKDAQTDELVFFPDAGYRLDRIGIRYVAVVTGADLADRFIFSTSDNDVTYHAAFFLP